MSGIIEVLAVGKGHDEVKLPDDGVEAKAHVDDLKKKGYAIFVSHEGTDYKVDDFDPVTKEYVITQTVTEQKEVRIPAATAKATAIAPTAGG